MKKYFLILLITLSTPTAYAAWSKQCLDDCFSTNHECSYCAYQCQVEEKYDSFPYKNDYKCPLEGYRS